MYLYSCLCTDQCVDGRAKFLTRKREVLDEEKKIISTSVVSASASKDAAESLANKEHKPASVRDGASVHVCMCVSMCMCECVSVSVCTCVYVYVYACAVMWLCA
jgi:hypothetical protein